MATIPNPNTFIGKYSAFAAAGGFFAEQGVPSVTLLRDDQINLYDVTQAVQVFYDVRTFNTLLGVLKDASNLNVLSSNYVPNTGFSPDTITLTAADFVNGVPLENIISVGKLKTLYSDFMEFISDYFDYPQGFTSLFSIESDYNINSGVFDASALFNLFSPKTDPDGQYVTELSGNIVLSNLNTLLQNVVDNNTFLNRQSGDAKYPAYPPDYMVDISDGFIEGDRVYVPNGIEVKLTLSVINNNVFPNYLGYEHGAAVSNDYHRGTYSQETTLSETNIFRVVKCPLLFSLKNISTGQSFQPGTSLIFVVTVSVTSFNDEPPPLNDLSIATILQTLADILQLDTDFVNYENQAFFQNPDETWDNTVIFSVIINLDTFVTPYTTVEELYNSFQVLLAQSLEPIPVPALRESVISDEPGVKRPNKILIRPKVDTTNQFTVNLNEQSVQNDATQLINAAVNDAGASNPTSGITGPAGPEGPVGPQGPEGDVQAGPAGPNEDVWAVVDSNNGIATIDNNKVLVGTSVDSGLPNILEVSGNVLFNSTDISGSLNTRNVTIPSGNLNVNRNIQTNALGIGKRANSSLAVDVSGSMYTAQLYLSKYQLPVSYTLAEILPTYISVKYNQGSVYYVNMAIVDATVTTMPFTAVVKNIDTSITVSRNIPVTFILDYTSIVGSKRNYCNQLIIDPMNISPTVYFSGGEPSSMTSDTKYLIQKFNIFYRNGQFKNVLCNLNIINISS